MLLLILTCIKASYCCQFFTSSSERNRLAPATQAALLASSVTMDTYVQAVSDEKRKAHSKVVEMIMPGIRNSAR